MADASNAFAIRAIAIDSTSWTPITCPIACNTWAIRPDAAVLIRTDKDDPNTQDSLSAGMQEMVTAPRGTSGTRFAANTTFLYAQAATGSTTIRATFSI